MKTKSFPWWRRIAILSMASALAAGSFAVSAAWDHNPQQEFHGVDGVNWVGLAVIGASWAAVVGGACWIPMAGLVWILGRLSSSDAA